MRDTLESEDPVAIYYPFGEKAKLFTEPNSNIYEYIPKYKITLMNLIKFIYDCLHFKMNYKYLFVIESSY